MSRALDDLSSDLQPLAMQVIARCCERGLALLIVDTLRTAAEHQINLANGTSATKRSKHLPRKLRGAKPTDPNAEKADAIDLVPYAVYQLHGPDKLQWDDKDPAWTVIGEEGEKLGLRWGGRWKNPHDPGHLEWTGAI